MTAMSAQLNALFQEYLRELSILRVKWRLYGQLFGDPGRVDLLNRHAAQGFGVVQDVLLKDIILCITRMVNTSKAAWGEPANLSTLIIDLAGHQQTALVVRLRRVLDRIKPAAESLRRLRDTRLAHNDYSAFLGMRCAVDALPAPDRRMVEDVLTAMGEVLDEIRGLYPDAEALGDDTSHAGDFEGLINELQELERRRNDETA